MFSSNEVTAKAFSLAPIRDLDGQMRIPIVVHTEQGGDLVSVGSNSRSVSSSKLHEAEIFPTNVFYLIDCSSSMEYKANKSQPESKLELVQNRISGLIDASPQSIEHIVVPYSDNASLFQTKNPSKEIKSLQPKGDTNIYSAFEKAIQFIKQETNPNHRNIILFFSDGVDTLGNSDEQIANLTQEFRKLNTGIFLVGTGINYKENLLRKVLQSVQFGGQSHIPEDQGHINVFEKILPKFVNEVCTATAFPIISFNRWFNKVVNLMPSTRDVLAEKTDSELAKHLEEKQITYHYPTVVGYQNQGFNIGFIDEKDFAQANIHLINRKSSNQKASSIEEIQIVPLNQAIGLDPSTRELIEQAPLRALIAELAQRRDPVKIKEFLESNPNLDSREKDQLKELIKIFNQHSYSPDPNNTQASLSHTGNASLTFTDASIADLLLSNQVPNPKKAASPGNNSGDTINGFESGNTINNVDLNPNQKSQTLKLKLTIQPPTELHQIKDPDPNGFITLSSVNPINIGRNPKSNNIIFQSDLVSRNHCQLLITNGECVIKDVGSTNGTYVNGKKIQTGIPVVLKDKDIISLSTNIALTLELAA